MHSALPGRNTKRSWHTSISKRHKRYGRNSNKASNPSVTISSLKRNRPPNCNKNKRRTSSTSGPNETMNAPKQKRNAMLSFFNNKKLPERPRNQSPVRRKPSPHTNKPKQMPSSRPFSAISRSPNWKRPALPD